MTSKISITTCLLLLACSASNDSVQNTGQPVIAMEGNPSWIDDEPLGVFDIQDLALGGLWEQKQRCISGDDVDCELTVQVTVENSIRVFYLNTVSGLERYNRISNASSPVFYEGHEAMGGRLHLTLYPESQGKVGFFAQVSVNGRSYFKNNMIFEDDDSEKLFDELLHSPLNSSDARESNSTSTTRNVPQRIFELATEADFEMYSLWEVQRGLSVNDIILGLVHSASGFMETNLGVELRVVHQHVWRQHNDPYHADLLEPLLRGFTDSHNFGNFDGKILFTGRDLAEVTLGLGWIGGVCNGGEYNTAVLDAKENSSLSTTTLAHEITHLLGAEHDDATECTGRDHALMCEYLIEGRHTYISDQSKEQIERYLSGKTCLENRPIQSANVQRCDHVVINRKAFQGTWEALSYDVEKDELKESHFEDAPTDATELNETVYPECRSYRSDVGRWDTSSGYQVEGDYYEYLCNGTRPFTFSANERSLTLEKKISRGGQFLMEQDNVILADNNRVLSKMALIKDQNQNVLVSDEWKDHDLDGLYDLHWEGHWTRHNAAYECTTLSERKMVFRRLSNGNVSMQGVIGHPLECNLAHFRNEVTCVQ